MAVVVNSLRCTRRVDSG